MYKKNDYSILHAAAAAYVSDNNTTDYLHHFEIFYSKKINCLFSEIHWWSLEDIFTTTNSFFEIVSQTYIINLFSALFSGNILFPLKSVWFSAGFNGGSKRFRNCTYVVISFQGIRNSKTTAHWIALMAKSPILASQVRLE